jgi:PhnB protein
MLTVSDIPAAVSFYQKAFGFSKRAIMKGPDGKPIHAELTLRGTTVMLGPENDAMGKRNAKSVGASPASLFIYVQNVDKVVDKATKLGATSQGPVMDMFWGDRCGTVVDPDGYPWMVGTHKAEPTAKEMKKGMLEMMRQQPTDTATAAKCILTRKDPAEHEFVRLPESCSTLRPGADSVAVDPGPLVLAASARCPSTLHRTREECLAYGCE